MNGLRRIVSRQLIFALGFMTSTGVLAQEESKTFQERFIVAKDAVLDINTSHADIEFETWDKDEVTISAIITLEGATTKEAEAYFKNSPIEIFGNSKKISIISKSGNKRFFYSQDSIFNFDFSEMHIEVPEIASFVVSGPQIAPFPEMPPLPQTQSFSFDYEDYQKDGEKYMKKWQKNFEKSFDKQHQQRLEEWASKMEEKAEEMQERLEQQHERRAIQMAERAKIMESRVKEREEQHKQRLGRRDASMNAFFMRNDSLGTSPNIFYLSNDGEQKNYKIKKTIKIKLPKSTRIQMDVRHGEVKLAENTKNLNANLSHSSLWASTIEGLETSVSVAYTPVTVQKWNYGQLKTSYSEEVALEEVIELQLQATSSNVTIGKLAKKAFIKNNFGPLYITNLGPSFEELDISLKNGELNLKLPEVATAVYVKGNTSSLKVPSNLQLTQTKNGSTTIHKGFHVKENSNRSLVITSEYSDVIIH